VLRNHSSYFVCFLPDYTFPIVTKASEESDRIPNGCKETFLFLRRGIRQASIKGKLKTRFLLKNFTMIRQPNATNYKITQQKWQRVHKLKG
jgi:hypothetical protein